MQSPVCQNLRAKIIRAVQCARGKKSVSWTAAVVISVILVISSFNSCPISIWLAKWCKIHKVYIRSHSMLYFLFTKIFTHICGCIYSHSTVYIRSHSQSKYWFNAVQYSFNIFCAPPLHIIRSQLPASPPIFLTLQTD